MKAILLLLICLFLVQQTHQDYIIDDYWKTISKVNNFWITKGNLTLWKCLECCADNDTVRPSNETRLINYINDSWCKGNETCMSFFPPKDIRHSYFDQISYADETSEYFWMWILKTSINQPLKKYVVCTRNYFPRWDYLMWCQGFGPSEMNNWFYGLRWYCGARNYYTVCNKQIEVVLGTPLDFNRTGYPTFVGRHYVYCCNYLSTALNRIYGGTDNF